MFDKGWKSFSVSDEINKPNEPQVGMRISLNKGRGKIIGVNRKANSKLCEITVQLDNDKSNPLVTLYTPAEMDLE